MDLEGISLYIIMAFAEGTEENDEELQDRLCRALPLR
jgi:hypothetical protein